MKDDHVIHPIDELRAKVSLDYGHDLGFHLLVTFFSCQLLDSIGTEIRRHHNNSIAKIHGPALTVGQATVIEHLQQHVEDFWMGFFNLIHQNH